MELAITLDHKSPSPLHRQLYEELRRAILARRLKPGERVPSTRAFAASLKLSRATVTQSYEQLVSEGYLQAVVGSGTTVCAQLPEELLLAAPVQAPKAAAQTKRAASAVKLSRYGASLDDSLPLEAPEPELPINFKSGRPALEEFPMREWRRLLLRHCRAGKADLLDYAPNLRGTPALRKAISDYLARSRAVRCTPEQVIIVNGSQQAIDLIAKVLMDRGDPVAIENPGYLGARRAFLAQGAKLLPVPVDENGIVVERLQAKPPGHAHSAKLIYVTPSHQFPTGAVLPLGRRLELIRWAESAGAVIVEDDYDSEFRYVSRPLTALQGLDTDGRVVYVGTFSKVMFPALRIGFVIAPSSLLPALVAARQFAGTQQAVLEQMVLADFIVDGHFERHVRRMRAVYAERQQDLIDALRSECGGLVEASPAGAGMHLVGWLAPQTDASDVSRRAAARGVDVIPLSAFSVGRGAGRPGIVLGYAHVDRATMFAAARQLAAAIRESVAATKRSDLLNPISRSGSKGI